MKMPVNKAKPVEDLSEPSSVNPRYSIGDRVGAMMSANESTVRLYGYGVYEGEQVPTRGYPKDLGMENPKIKLDDGQIVYGFECWWGPEEKIKKIIGTRPVQVVPCPRD